MTDLARTRTVLQDAIARRVFPGAIVEVGSHAAPIDTVTCGTLSYDTGSRDVTVSTIYDLASLTKVLCTTTLAAGLIERGRLRLEDPVGLWAPPWRTDGRSQVTVRHLLLHASGLPAHRRYFETMKGGDAIEAAISTEDLEYGPGTRSVYSDPGFILLGRIVERAGGLALDSQFDAWRHTLWSGPPMLAFHPSRGAHGDIAPTEIDSWRGRLLAGEVHDENAAALGGVAGHAGLFGTASAVGRCARWWMARVDQEPWRTFVHRGDVPGSSRALGWDTMLPSSSCGSRMSPRAIGHTGFTGTSLWIDPEQDRYVVFLSNRVHPTRSGEEMSRVRPALHDAVATDLSAAPNATARP